MVMGSSELGGVLSQLPPLRAVSSQAPLALQLPFLLWAAVRFGTPGAGVTLFAATILAVWSVVHGQGPFAEMSPTATGPALTLSFIVVAGTVLSLAALVEERRQTQSALAERLGFEELLARLSGAFVRCRAITWMPASTSGSAGSGCSSKSSACVCIRCRKAVKVSALATNGHIPTSKRSPRRTSRATFRGRSTGCSNRCRSCCPRSETCRRRRLTTSDRCSGLATRPCSSCRSCPATARLARWHSARLRNGRGRTRSS
jgi:hypothetical protein